MLKIIRELIGRRKKSPKDSDLVRPPVHHGPKVEHQPISHSDLDPDAVKIVQRLTRFDHNAYFVGGCVRDLLLDRKPKDFDIGTSATPRQIKRLFRNSRIIGRRFRLAHIYFQNGKIIEVATFRSRNEPDSEAAASGRDLLIRDDNEFGSPEEDALRRDFTINALFYDLNDGNVLDYADGLADLRRKLVRTIGDPKVRFREDPIRILRAIKFAARLDFKIEAKTMKAIRDTRDEIPRAAMPRILEEINRFGRERAARRSFELLRETGVFDVILPELSRAYRDRERWEFFLALLTRMDRRRIDGAEVTPGEIFAALLLPVMLETLGWDTTEYRHPPKGFDIREAIDKRLQPIALRLRLPRREQERCRQILSQLFRMVPWSQVRPATGRAILRRVSFPLALWMLEIAADRFGGELTASFKEWTRSAGDSPGLVAQQEDEEEGDSGRTRSRRRRPRGRGRDGTSSASPTRSPDPARSGSRDDGDEPKDDTEESPRKRRPRRRGGRGRRRRGPTDEAASAGGDANAPPSDRPDQPRKDAPAQPSPPRNKPEKWDDDYFFAALPNVPEMEGEVHGDRYGASSVTVDADPPVDHEHPPDSSAESATTEENPAKASRSRPRRRRRRRKPGDSAGTASPESTPDEPTSDDSD